MEKLSDKWQLFVCYKKKNWEEDKIWNYMIIFSLWYFFNNVDIILPQWNNKFLLRYSNADIIEIFFRFDGNMWGLWRYLTSFFESISQLPTCFLNWIGNLKLIGFGLNRQFENISRRMDRISFVLNFFKSYSISFSHFKFKISIINPSQTTFYV